jgi:hypothetical protein
MGDPATTPVRILADRFRPDLFVFFRCPMAQILEDSPPLVAGRDAQDQFRTLLRLCGSGPRARRFDALDWGRVQLGSAGTILRTDPERPLFP